MTKRKKPTSKQRRKNPRDAAVERAAQLFREFREAEPGRIKHTDIRTPAAAIQVGELDGVMYRTTHGGKREKYLHTFRKNARPQMLASHDGKQLLIVGGNFTFTRRGIVDGRTRQR